MDRWLRGKAYLKEEQGGLEVRAAFEDAGPGALLFDVVVANRGPAPVLVAPEQFQVVLGDLPEGSLAPREYAAVDPEVMIHQLGRASAAEQATKGATNAFRGIFLLADLGDTLTGSTQRNPREQREVRQDNRETYRDMDAADRNADARLSGLAGQRRHWEEDCVRKTTLDPGYGLRGKVVFHLDARRAGKVALRVPVGSQTFQFDFRTR
ncbi:MAG TPA: hypothetical protein VF804_15935 [Holophagaceae bacterium]